MSFKLFCFLRLKTAAILIAIYEMITFSIVMIHAGEDAYVSWYNKEYEFDFHHGNNPNAPIFQDHYKITNARYFISFTRTVICAVRIGAAVALIFGIQKAKLDLVQCWVWIKVLTIFTATILLLVTVFNEDPDSSTNVLLVSRILLEVFFLWVISKFSVEMKEDSPERIIPKPRVKCPPNSVAATATDTCKIPYTQFE